MSGAKKILVVDDEEEIRELLEFFFELDGYDVVTASSGNRGFACFQEQKFDLIVSDIRMADGTGVDLLKKIKKAGDQGTRVVFLTGYADITVEDGIAMGAYRVLPKPIKSEELLSVVRDALCQEKTA